MTASELHEQAQLAQEAHETFASTWDGSHRTT